MASSEHQTSALLFTDIDGTLVAHDTYDPGPAAESVAKLQRAGIPVVLCSAKTRAEQEAIRVRLDLDDPYIVENGAGVIFPVDFPGSLAGEGEQELVTFGLTYREVREGLELAAAEAGLEVKGFGDLSVEEVSSLTGLTLAGAAKARNREFTETFVIENPTPEREVLLSHHLEERGMGILHGARYWTALGRHDKGQAVRFVISRYEGSGSVTSYAVGDSVTDLGMLEAVDIPMLVQQADGSWADLDLKGLVRLKGIGPEGWSRAAHVLLKR
ncbi:MAG: HAD-IIB family hydrolase [Acidimicrobiia bacterium]|nr:HAD-IIB family hydrolase [Acidimicrobiia bacterium]